MKNYLINEITKMRVLGRNVPGGICVDGAVHLFWAGSAFEVCVKASEVWAEISCDYDVHEIWLAVEVNGYQIARFAAPKEPVLICLAHNLNPEKENLISIIKDTQPMPGDHLHELKITGLRLDDEGLFSIPDIPNERRINMNTNSEEIEELMGGKDIDEDTKDKKKK